ncbi:MAG: sensor histidine kinase [Flavobacteriales bacterium]
MFFFIFVNSTFAVYSDELVSISEVNQIHILPQDSKTIFNAEQAYLAYKNGEFNDKSSNKILHKINPNKDFWVHIILPNSKDNINYFGLWNQYLDQVEIHKIENGNLSDFELFSHQKPSKSINFRLPTWKIESRENIELLLRLKSSVSFVSTKPFFLNEYEFQSFLKKDLSTTIVFLTFLISIFIINIIIYINQGEQSIIWYGIFILFSIYDLVIYKSLISSNDSILLQNHKTLFLVLGTTCLLLFQYYFYGRSRFSSFFKNTFRALITLNIILSLCYIAMYNSSYFLYTKSIIWVVTRIEILVLIIFHIVLAYQKKIPQFLALGFLLPLFIYLFKYLYNPPITSSINFCLFIDNSQYIATSIELITISSFIISEIIKKNKIAVKLKQENLELQYSFESKIQLAQTEERKKLLNNVHDSFGGYLAALKMHLSSDKTQNHQVIENMVDAFVVDYRFLLNNLSFPEITPENMTQQLNQYCTRVNQITNNRIVCNFSLHRAKLPKPTCEHLYRILSELLTNAIKHSDASRINITLQEVDNHTIILEVIDNGIGFKLNPNRTSFGISSVQKRVEEINGSLKIDSKINKGTHIAVTLNVS